MLFIKFIWERKGVGGYNLAYKFISFSPNSFKRYRMLLNVLRILLLNKIYFFFTAVSFLLSTPLTYIYFISKFLHLELLKIK